VAAISSAFEEFFGAAAFGAALFVAAVFFGADFPDNFFSLDIVSYKSPS
jgi:hypothetical protein